MSFFSGERKRTGLQIVPPVKRAAPRKKRALSAAVIALGLFVSIIVFQAYAPKAQTYVDSSRFDYVYVISPAYVYRGNQGVLLLDKRNGNVWFFPRTNNLDLAFRDPVLVSRLPLEKLDEMPR